MRQQLLSEILWFVPAVARLPGVQRIALLGSLTTEKKDPKDIDFLVVVDDDISLEPLAKIGRKVKGHAQQLNRGADIFLANARGHYIGRTCHWRQCGPGIRRSCDALHCGRRHYLHDDLEAVTLSDETVRSGVELWPVVARRAGLPDDVEKVLEQLQAGQGLNDSFC
jgi:hypothetical protein